MQGRLIIVVDIYIKLHKTWCSVGFNRQMAPMFPVVYKYVYMALQSWLAMTIISVFIKFI